MDLEHFFKQYEALVSLSEEAFGRVKKEHSPLVKCRVACDDCCFALFDLTLIEALYINHQFKRAFKGKDRDRLLEIENRVDRQLYKIKRKASRDLNAGIAEERIMMDMAGARMRCPLLNDKQTCELYRHRPITCRLYGIPTAIGGETYTCGKSGFAEGRSYPTVNIDAIQKRLFGISADLLTAIKSKHFKMADMVVPLSMALLTDYSEAYLGVQEEKEDRQD